MQRNKFYFISNLTLYIIVYMFLITLTKKMVQILYIVLYSKLIIFFLFSHFEKNFFGGKITTIGKYFMFGKSNFGYQGESCCMHVFLKLYILYIYNIQARKNVTFSLFHNYIQ